MCGKGFARKYVIVLSPLLPTMPDHRYCLFRFTFFRDKLQEHARHHNKNITFPCSACEETFNMRSKLNKHLREVHNIRQSTRLSKESVKTSSKKKKARNSEPVTQVTVAPTNNLTTTGIFQNPANFLWCQRQPQNTSNTSAFDFWNAQNQAQLYTQQYGYNHLYYAAAAMRQNPQQSSALAAHMFSQVSSQSFPPIFFDCLVNYLSRFFYISRQQLQIPLFYKQQLLVIGRRISVQRQLLIPPQLQTLNKHLVGHLSKQLSRLSLITAVMVIIQMHQTLIRLQRITMTRHH